MRLIKIIAYGALFIISFAYFFYRSIPYDAVKDRVFLTIERQLGQQYSIDADKLSPYYLTGLELEGVVISDRNGRAMLKVDRLQGRASLFSLIFGNPNISFELKMGSGYIDGEVRQNDEGWKAALDLDELDVSKFPLVLEKIGLNLASKVSGQIELDINQKQITKSSGALKVKLDSLQIKEGKFQVMGSEIDIPAIVLSKKSGSEIAGVMKDGVLDLGSFKLAGGDVTLDVKGKVFISNALNNWRFNINGKFGVADALAKQLPFLFILERQKQVDGSYPLAVSGRLDKPIIKIGTFTLPL